MTDMGKMSIRELAQSLRKQTAEVDESKAPASFLHVLVFNTLANRFDECQDRIEELQAENERLKKYNRSMSEACNDYDERLVELEAEVDRLRPQVAGSDIGVAILKRELERRKAEVERLQAVVDAAKELENWITDLDDEAGGNRAWHNWKDALAALKQSDE